MNFNAVEILQIETIKKILISEEISNGEEYLLVLDYLNGVGADLAKKRVLKS